MKHIFGTICVSDPKGAPLTLPRRPGQYLRIPPDEKNGGFIVIYHKLLNYDASSIYNRDSVPVLMPESLEQKI